jgi:hypothetical protein
MSFFHKKKEVDTVQKLNELRSLLDPEINSSLSDEDCFRFLKARSYDITKATEMITKWSVWWNIPMPGTTTAPKDVLENINDDKESLFKNFLPQSNLSEDKEGHPIYWEKTGYGNYYSL